MCTVSFSVYSNQLYSERECGASGHEWMMFPRNEKTKMPLGLNIKAYLAFYIASLLCMLSCRLVHPAKMSSSSTGDGEGQMLSFMTKKCRCRRKTTIRIVESEKPSKGRLYYICENASLGGCDIWAWCNLVGYAPIYGRDEIDDEKPRVEKGVQFNGRLMKLEMKMEALTMMMKTSMVVLLVCFIASMLMFSMK
ncbi:hypothetical protein CsSME_00042111 [Camellia sinensis var. sinensis]